MQKETFILLDSEATVSIFLTRKIHKCVQLVSAKAIVLLTKSVSPLGTLCEVGFKG